jgi:hypothetical protein
MSGAYLKCTGSVAPTINGSIMIRGTVQLLVPDNLRESDWVHLKSLTRFCGHLDTAVPDRCLVSSILRLSTELLERFDNLHIEN